MRSFSLRHNKRLQNLFALLDSLTAKGLVCGVKDEGAGPFFVKGKVSQLSEWERAGIDVCRAGLREAWLLQNERCIVCGLDPAIRPNPEGRVLVGVTFNEETNKTAYRWAKCSSLLIYPFLCDDCYDNPKTWRDLIGNTYADSDTEKDSTDDSPPLQPARRRQTQTQEGQERFLAADAP